MVEEGMGAQAKNGNFQDVVQNGSRIEKFTRSILFLTLAFLTASCYSAAQETIFTPTIETPKPEATVTATIQPATAIPLPWHKVIQDGGFLSEEPCGPPCFLGITPSITKIDQVEPILNEKGLGPYCKADYREDLGIRYLTCLPWLGFSAPKQTAIINGVSFTPSITVTLKDTIDKYGKPSHVVVLIGGLPDYPQRAQIRLYYDDILTELWFPEIEGEVYALQPWTAITEIIYLDQTSFEEYRSLPLQHWSGYGQYTAK